MLKSHLKEKNDLLMELKKHLEKISILHIKTFILLLLNIQLKLMFDLKFISGISTTERIEKIIEELLNSSIESTVSSLEKTLLILKAIFKTSFCES